MSSGIPSRMWFSSHSNVWSSVVSVKGNKKKKKHIFFNHSHALLYAAAAEDSHSLLLFIPEQQLEVECRTTKHSRVTLLLCSISAADYS